MNWIDLTNALTILAEQAQTPYTFTNLPADFQTMMPRFVEYGEGRIYRDCVFLATRTQDSSLSFTGNTRSLNLNNMTTVVIVPEGLAAILPQSDQPAAGTRWQFQKASLDVIDSVWPDESTTQNSEART